MKYLALLAAGVSLVTIAGCGSSKTTSSDSRNQVASLPATSQFDPHGWKVITTAVDRNDNTMLMLYGNDLAVKTARTGHTTYPPGSVLSLVTWKSQEDDHWFGANMPAAVQSVEQVTFAPTGTAQPSYERYEGSALKKTALDSAAGDKRIAYIVNQRAAVMP